MKSVGKSKRVLDAALKKWDSKIFKKWFGVSNRESNRDVKTRFARAVKVMFEPKKIWTVMCCKKAIGACSGCEDRTLAYVTSGYQSDGSARGVKKANVNIRMCPLSFTEKKKHINLGMTIFHEIVHMTSGVGDKGYTKKQCFDLAKRNPTIARQNSAAYAFFAMESGLNKKNYEIWSEGKSILNQQC